MRIYSIADFHGRCRKLSRKIVTTKVVRLETTKTENHKGTKKEKILKCLVFLVSLCLCGD